MQNKTVIFTGGNSGLGFECARAILLSQQSWHVVIACRNPIKGQKACDALNSEGRKLGSVMCLPLNLTSFVSIRKFVTLFRLAKIPPLRALVNNAGIQVMSGLEYTDEGNKLTFGTNHLGHFLLTNLLLDLFEKPARIVVVSSGTHDTNTIDGRFNKPVFLGGTRLPGLKAPEKCPGYSVMRPQNLLI